MAHCYRWEGGGAAVFGSVQPQPLDHQPDGTLALKDIEAAIKPDDAHFARTRLLALENTLGGKLLPFDYVEQATQLAQRKGLARHLDGARLFNAAVAQAAQRGTDARAEARRIARLLRQRLGLLQQGPRRAGGLGAVRIARVDRAGPPHPQDGRRRHAPGRHAGGSRVPCAATTTSIASPRTTRSRAAWPRAWPASRA